MNPPSVLQRPVKIRPESPFIGPGRRVLTGSASARLRLRSISEVMGIIGSPIETSLLQAAQAQQVAARNRDREKAAQDSAARRFQDIIELRVAGVEAAEALRKLPSNDSEQAEAEHQSRDQFPADDHDAADGAGRIDVQA
jgi:hypothetical protein